MNVCDSCSNHIKSQSTRYIKGYTTALHTLLVRKQLCSDLIDLIIGFLVNEKGHAIYYDLDTRMYRVCSPCYQVGLHKYVNTHYAFISLPNMRGQEDFARWHGHVWENVYQSVCRRFLLKYFLGDYKLNKYRETKPSRRMTEDGHILYTVDYF